jgi:protein-tyrosine phosphatase
MRALVGDIETAGAEGRVAIACMGGVGRTGTIAACALVAGGMTPGDAIATVRSIRHPTAVETAAQEAFVHAFASAIDTGD